MDAFLRLVLLPGLVAASVAYLATPLVILWAKKVNIIDDPKKNKHPKVIHTYPVPRAGGLATGIGIGVAILVFLPIDKHILGILLGAIIVVVLGLLDDKYNLNPYLRLAIQFVTAGFPIAAGIGIAFLTNPFGGIINLSQPQINFSLFGQQHSIWVLSDAFALLWIVLMMNMLNMGAKGVDGQLPGVVSITAIVIAILSLRYSADITQWPVIILAAIVAGAYFGFLPWNFYPQKIMPGYSGSTLAGFLLAILAILSTTKVGTLIVCLGVPLVDTSYTIIRRILTGRSPVWGDRGHLHHKLLDSGFSKRQVALFYWSVTATLGIMALSLNASFKLYTIVGIIATVGVLLLWLTNRSHKLIR
jgi:UDP-GlcNAc:undecaprenyl-phosphate/decaprenyl-phosphate GlcNAc-1-phosphate transferase